MLAGRAADAVNAFAFDVYEHMQRQDGNLFFSPLSVATALSMTYAGAAGQTATEMEQVLHLGSEPGIHEAFGELLATWDAASHGPVVTVANAIWPQVGLPVVSEFMATIEGSYGGHVQALDYSSPATGKDIINDWVADATRNRIRNLVEDLDPATVMVLTNSVYFKGLWERPFDRGHTRPGSFALDDDAYVPANFMTTYFTSGATTIDGHFVLDMPFKTGVGGRDFSMVFVLPPAASDGGLASETYAKIDDWLDGPQPSSFWDGVQVTMPKFRIEVSTHLNRILSDLGMPTAFSPGGADFSGMTSSGVWISRVFHKTFLEVNEEGTEAAAATEVALPICFAQGTPVLTPGGEKPIDELQPGDLVLARHETEPEGDSLPQRVEAVHRGEATIWELAVGGQVVRTTALHPFFVIGKGWTPAAELRRGDLLSTRSGHSTAIDDVRATNVVELVYNLRVAAYRTYFVGSASWGFGLWVHNSCVAEVSIDRPFHVFVRDNASSTILFMGRVSSPVQPANSVTPSVVVPSADFDGNLMVDGADFLAWQRGVGRTTGATEGDGDSDGDGDVDRSDLGIWFDAFGAIATAAASQAPAIVAESLPAGMAPDATPADVLDAALQWNGTAGGSHAEDDWSGSESSPAAIEPAIPVRDAPGFSPLPARPTPARPGAWSSADEGAAKDADAALETLGLSSLAAGIGLDAEL